MKKSLFAFLAITLFACNSDDSLPVEANTVYVGFVHLTTQAEVDAFAAKGYSKIDGNVSIGGELNDPDSYSEITSLEGLSSLKEITGQLTIERNAFLTSLQGLHNLVTAQNVNLKYNLSLLDTKGLQQITTLGDEDYYSGNIIIENNPSLESIEGFENVHNITRLTVSNNHNLQNMKGFQGLEEISFLTISNNDALTSISDLYGLKGVGYFDEVSFSVLEIYGNDLLTSLDGLQNITYLETKFEVTYNNQLTDFCALKNVLTNVTDHYVLAINGNAYNPTLIDITLGSCSQ